VGDCRNERKEQGDDISASTSGAKTFAFGPNSPLREVSEGGRRVGNLSAKVQALNGPRTDVRNATHGAVAVLEDLLSFGFVVDLMNCGLVVDLGDANANEVDIELVDGLRVSNHGVLILLT
jgi:hypothetical protein